MNQGSKVDAAIEAMLFAAGEPLEAERIAGALELELSEVEHVLAHMNAQMEERGSGLRIVRLQNKYQMCTRAEYAEAVRSVLEMKRNAPLSQAAFEVLAVVAYNQPVTRAFVEQVRGVDCTGPMLGLVQKGLIEEKGRLELPGRPLTYGTTDTFLRCFSLNGLEELPSLPVKEEKEDPAQTTIQEFVDEGNELAGL